MRTDTAHLSGTIIRNTGYNFAGFGWTLGISLVLTPYLIGRLGMERFGIWAVLSAFTGAFGLLDCGIGSAFVKFIAEHAARRDERALRQTVSTGTFFYAALAVLLIGAAALGAAPILSLLRIPAPLQAEAHMALVVSVLAFGITQSLSAFSSIQTGLQRMDITNRISVVLTALSAGMTVLFVETGAGLIGLSAAACFTALLRGACDLTVAARLLPKVGVRVRDLDRQTLRTLFSFGIRLQMAKFAELIGFGFDKLLLSRYLSVTAAGLYQSGALLAAKARDLSALLLAALTPAAAQLDACQDRAKLMALYERSFKYLAAAAVPLMTLLCVSAQPLIRAWLGQGYPAAVTALRALCGAYLLNVLGGPAVSIAKGMGQPGFQMRAAALQTTLNVVLGLVLIKSFGMQGLLAAVAAAMGVSYIYTCVTIHRFLKIPLVSFWARFLSKPLFAASLGALFSTALLAITGGWKATRWGNIGIFSLSAAGFLCVYAAVLNASRFLDALDRDILKELLQKAGCGASEPR